MLCVCVLPNTKSISCPRSVAEPVSSPTPVVQICTLYSSTYSVSNLMFGVVLCCNSCISNTAVCVQDCYIWVDCCTLLYCCIYEYYYSGSLLCHINTYPLYRTQDGQSRVLLCTTAVPYTCTSCCTAEPRITGTRSSL